MPYSRRRGFPLNSKRKHSEIWTEFVKFWKKSSVEQPTNKVQAIQISTII